MLTFGAKKSQKEKGAAETAPKSTAKDLDLPAY
jgi:hypothetical protein